MRGAVQYDATFDLAPLERMKMFDFINERIKSQKDAMVPIY